MSIEFQILGEAGRDNAVYARVNTGQAIHRLLFDCGEGCVGELSVAEAQAIDHLFFSHLHMDHVGGFDTLFRQTFFRERPLQAWGPPETRRILGHRLEGYLWNLYDGGVGVWEVNDIAPEGIARSRYREDEAFAIAHPAPLADDERLPPPLIIATPEYTVEALAMDHLTPSMAYVLRERPRLNVDTERMAALGLRPGPWLKLVKEAQPDEPPTILIGETPHELAALRAALLVATPGDSLAYCTDFLLDEAAMQRLAPALAGCQTLVCESQYASADAELAARHHHMTSAQAAELARRAGVGQLLLFHLSDRYRHDAWRTLLAEAQAVFPNTQFPARWALE